MVEDLAVGNLIPLGKYLLGSVYHMLHHVDAESALSANHTASRKAGFARAERE
jgi:hypothetical protein